MPNEHDNSIYDDAEEYLRERDALRAERDELLETLKRTKDYLSLALDLWAPSRGADEDDDRIASACGKVIEDSAALSASAEPTQRTSPPVAGNSGVGGAAEAEAGFDSPAGSTPTSRVEEARRAFYESARRCEEIRDMLSTDGRRKGASEEEEQAALDERERTWHELRLQEVRAQIAAESDAGS